MSVVTSDITNYVIIHHTDVGQEDVSERTVGDVVEVGVVDN